MSIDKSTLRKMVLESASRRLAKVNHAKNLEAISLKGALSKEVSKITESAYKALKKAIHAAIPNAVIKDRFDIGIQFKLAERERYNDIIIPASDRAEEFQAAIEALDGKYSEKTTALLVERDIVLSQIATTPKDGEAIVSKIVADYLKSEKA